MTYLAIGLGGALGAISRVALERVFPPLLLSIPIKIMCVNVLGCLALGMLTGVIALQWNTPLVVRHFLIQGFLGGFTTFSAFALEFGLLYEEGFYVSAVLYALLSVSLSIALFFGGLKIVRFLLA